MRKEALELANQYLHSIRQRYTVRLGILFGSSLLGEWTENSDLDVLIVADELSGDIGKNYESLKEQFVEPFGIKTNAAEGELERLNMVFLDGLQYGHVLVKDANFHDKILKKFHEITTRHEMTWTPRGWNFNTKTLL